MEAGAVDRGENGQWDMTGNYWYQQSSKYDHAMNYNGTFLDASSQAALEKAVKIFDANPAEVLWFEQAKSNIGGSGASAFPNRWQILDYSLYVIYRLTSIIYPSQGCRNQTV